MKYRFEGVPLRHVPLATAAVMLLAMGVALYWQILQSRDADAWVLHTQEVLTTIGAVREKVGNVESAQRERALTAAIGPAQRRDRQIEDLFAQLASLQALVSDNRQQSRRAQELSMLLQRRMRLAFGTAGTAQWPTLTDGWRADVAQADEVTRRMQAEERRLFDLRRSVQVRRQDAVLAGLVGVVLAGFLLLMPAYWLATRHRRHVRDLRQQLDDLVSDLPVTVWQMRSTTARQRRFEYVSAGSQRERGLTKADVLASEDGLSNHVIEEDRERIEAARRASEAHERPFDESYRIRLPDGSLRWLHSHATVRKQRDGSLLWNGYWQDVTRYVKLEHELRAANRDLRAFTYTVSHDLRAPLAAIDGFAKALTAHAAPVLDDRGSHLLARIRAGSHRMQDLVEGLLELGKLESHPLVVSEVDLSQVAREVVQEHRDADPTRQVEVDIEPQLRVNGDARLLRQVIANLLGNAWKFTAGQQPARIRLGNARASDGDGLYFVKDNGVGFDMNYSHKLFGAFQRLHAEREFPGTGIGLATVRRIVERHGGAVCADSTPGDGACFYFSLPAARVAVTGN